MGSSVPGAGHTRVGVSTAALIAEIQAAKAAVQLLLVVILLRCPTDIAEYAVESPNVLMSSY